MKRKRSQSEKNRKVDCKRGKGGEAKKLQDICRKLWTHNNGATTFLSYPNQPFADL
jgi:hypothetical protein